MTDARPLPMNWSATTLDDVIACLESGSRPRGGVSGIDSGVPSLGGEHLGVNGGFRFEKMRFVPEVFALRQTKGWIKPGDILVVKDGATTGKVSFVGTEFPYARALLNEHVFRCAVASPIDARFIFYWLYSSEGNRRILLDFRGAAQGGISRGFVSKVSVPIAPVSEQHRIVEAIDSYLTRIDDAVASLERVQGKLKAYRASVLKAAVEGRLVPTEASLARVEKRDSESAEALLSRTLKERRRRWEEAELAKLQAAGKNPKDDKWKSQYRDASPINISELGEAALGLPVGWCWASVGQMAWLVKDGPHYSPPYAKEGVPFITGGQVRPWGVDFDAAKRISPEVHRKLSARVLPEFGDLLYTKGGTTGIARVNTYEREFSVWVHVAVLKLTGLINPFYLQHALNSPWCYVQAQRFTHGVGNQDLGLTRMVKIVFPLPPREEQDRIVEEVERLDSIVRESASLVDTQVQRARRLRQALLKWAFEGKLVDQDPSDEPAEGLLARIRAKRHAPASTKKTRGRAAKGAA